MGPDELLDVIQQCVTQLYDQKTLKQKAKRTLAATGNWEAAEFAYETNMNYRTIAMALGSVA